MRRDEDTDVLIKALLNPRLFGRDVRSVELVETHISWVLLTGDLAYKIKKPLKLPFLDFTTLDARRHYCEEELRLNRRLAAELYLGLIPIGGSPDAPSLGKEPAIEYAVKMREFPADARLDRRLASGSVGNAEIREFADLIGRFHISLPRPPAESIFGAADQVLAVIDKNLAETAAAIPGTLEPNNPLREYLSDHGRRSTTAIENRRCNGAIKECHGDLHLENLVVWHGRILAFDALEFDPSLRWIDVVDETAFVTMDLIAHERRDLAFSYLSRYLEVTGDYGGVELLTFYMVHRALVRAKVRAIKARQAGSERPITAPQTYLEVAMNLLARRTPTLIITHGLSGSGKTTWTESLIGLLPAIRLRSDIERKRMLGLAERARSDSPLGGGIYADSSTDATYTALAHGAEIGLRAGFNVIVDATFLRIAHRQRFAELAAHTGSKFIILDLYAPDDVLRRRLVSRQTQKRDASEATVQTLDYQLERREELTPAERARAVGIDTEQGPLPERIAASIWAF